MTATQIYNATLTENSQNYSDFFTGAKLLWLELDGGEWSQNGEFVEVDGDLLITVADGVKRRVDLFDYVSSREIVTIPQEIAESGLLCELVLQASFSVSLRVVAWFDVASSCPTACELQEQLAEIQAVQAAIAANQLAQNAGLIAGFAATGLALAPITGGASIPALPGAVAPALAPGVAALTSPALSALLPILVP